MTNRSLLTLLFSLVLTANLSLAQHDHHQHGEVDFHISCTEAAQDEFQRGLAQLHHMMYEQARPHFQAAAEADPQCAMAHWGIAMTSFQPLWQPTGEEDLARGKDAVQTAREIGAATDRENAHITAVEAFFTDPDPPAPDRPSDHEARLQAWLEAQRAVHEAHPDDVDAAAFYGLAEVSYATTQFSPDEESDYTRQRRAGELLEGLIEDHPEHPGLHHYLIHAYDSPELAPRAEHIAARYDQLAPETPHALHMPSHIFVRLGKWERVADLDERAAEAALRQVDFDPHAMAHYVHSLDYAMYAYLQMGEEDKARQTLEKVRGVEEVPSALAYAYAVAAPQARYYLEQQKWEEAARLEPRFPDVMDWEAYPAADALFHYARGLGAARTGDLAQAEAERIRIESAVTALRDQGDHYWAYMTDALGQAVDAWIAYERGDTDQALRMMSEAADLEDSMDKHPITPGEILPVRELYAELLLREGRTEEARSAFEASLDRTPNRRNARHGLDQVAAAR